MRRRLDRTAFQQFVEEYVAAHPREHLGKKFLLVHFPGEVDVDVTEEDNLTHILHHIEDRYVVIPEHEPQRGEVLEVANNGR